MEAQKTSASNDIKKDVSFDKVTVDHVELNEMNRKYFSAQLRQIVTTVAHYPSARPNAGLNDSLFAVEDFDISSEPMESTQTRMAWIDTPIGTTAKAVEGILAKNPNAKIIRIVSNTPIISPGQQSVIDSANTTLTKDAVAERQLVRVPMSATENAGEIRKDRNGKLQYAINVFSIDGSKEDQDLRDADTANSYVPAALALMEADLDVEQ